MSTQNIYKRVLEIGSEYLECGISFNTLKERLKEEDFDVDNTCLNRCLREWFFSSFFHEETVCNHGNSSIKDLDKHLGCNFILKAETCLRILSYEEAEKSNQLVEQLTQQTRLYQSQVGLLQSQLSLAQTSIDNSKEDSKSARIYAILALVVSGVFGLFSVLTYFGIEYPKDVPQEQLKLITLQEQQLIKQDSLIKALHQIHNDVQIYSQQHKVFESKKVFDK